MFGGRPQPASIAYPDPLTGFAAFSAALGALGSGADVEVSLAEVVAPLTSLGERPLGRGDPRVVRLLAERTGNAGRPPIVRVGDPASSSEVDAGTRSSGAMRRQAEPAGR
jgi:hypothetical protein